MALPPELQAKTLVALAKAEIVTPPSYISPNILPVGGQLIFASYAKTGKSFMMLEMARALGSADSPFGAPHMVCPRACKVLLIEQELGEFSLKERVQHIYTPAEIKRQGFMADNCMYLSKVPELLLDTKKGIDMLYQVVDDVKPDVLMLDPLGKFHNMNESDNQEVGRLFSILDKLQKDYPGMSLVMSYHFSKPPDQRAGFDLLDPYRMNGAAKFFNNPDSIITAIRTHNLDTKAHKSWSVTMRMTLRHGESPDDMILHINEHGDCGVRYYRTVGQEGATKPLAMATPGSAWPNKKQEKPIQMAFQSA